jgi:Uma2 family endonuclease
MIQTISKTITFDEFVAWYPENSVHKYELHNGVIVEMPLGTGDHLVDGEYQISQFRGDDIVESLAFPELRLTVEQIFRAGLPATEPS